MLSMAVRATVDASSPKPLAFSCASISPRPFDRALAIPAAPSGSLSDSRCRVSHHWSSRRELGISAPVVLAADALVADEESVDNSFSEAPLETELISGCEAYAETTACTEVHLDGEEHRENAWEEPKVLLESKPWIPQKQMIILLNRATDIINLWQQSGGDLS